MNPTVSTVGAALRETKLAAIVASAIDIAPPERIIVFGSATRGEMVDGSLDLLVVAARAQAMCGRPDQRGANAAEWGP